jgi:hypothetical protein
MILASLILLPVSAAYAQNAAPRVTTAPTATVHIYRLRVFAGSKRRMTLSLDGERFAYLQNGRYWTVRLAPGDHVIADKKPDDSIKFSVVAGGVYYVRCEWVESRLLGFNARFSIVGTETATGDVRRLKFGDDNEIQNRKIVLIKP